MVGPVGGAVVAAVGGGVIVVPAGGAVVVGAFPYCGAGASQAASTKAAPKRPPKEKRIITPHALFQIY
jgi:hypothetical protein